jgi:hypothetical protein
MFGFQLLTAVEILLRHNIKPSQTTDIFTEILEREN